MGLMFYTQAEADHDWRESSVRQDVSVRTSCARGRGKHTKVGLVFKRGVTI